MSFNILSSSGNSLYYIAPHKILVKMSISYWDGRAEERLKRSWSRLQSWGSGTRVSACLELYFWNR